MLCIRNEVIFLIDQLIVKDYILFDYAEIDFHSGMSVITGETGAGKSLLIDAIGYLCGKRIQSNIVRQGKEKAVLKLVLSNIPKSVYAILTDNDIEIDEDQLIIQRVVNLQGKSTIRLNQQVTTLSFVKSITSQLIDIHSQMDTYELIRPEVQLDLLDNYINQPDLLENVQAAYKEYSKNKLAYFKAKDETYSDDELDFITKQIEEIDEANIKENELKDIQKSIKECLNLQSVRDSLSKCIHLLEKDDGVNDSLFTISKELKGNFQLEECGEYFNNQYYSLLDKTEELQNLLNKFTHFEYDLDELQDREYKIKHILKKYGGNYESLALTKIQLLNKVDTILHKEDTLDKLKTAMDTSLNKYMCYAEKLSKLRQSCFNTLSEKVQKHFQDLKLEHAQFRIDRNEIKPSEKGIDSIEFQVSMNIGMPFIHLKDSASGGELSRLMLALKVVFQATQGIDTIIFDEIDTGVSGKVAFAMGKKMKKLSNTYQVLCITHLASVAAFADKHFYVSKETFEQETETKIQLLTYENTINELALMSSGNVSKTSLDAAKELKERTQEN